MILGIYRVCPRRQRQVDRDRRGAPWRRSLRGPAEAAQAPDRGRGAAPGAGRARPARRRYDVNCKVTCKALPLLAEDGLIETRRGYGSFVAGRGVRPATGRAPQPVQHGRQLPARHPGVGHHVKQRPGHLAQRGGRARAAQPRGTRTVRPTARRRPAGGRDVQGRRPSTPAGPAPTRSRGARRRPERADLGAQGSTPPGRAGVRPSPRPGRARPPYPAPAPTPRGASQRLSPHPVVIDRPPPRGAGP